ncbi:hypothetical protein ANO11243_094490 [Dothideomycetidae sp. 11243]|nr:hypothetical protein ANO11243_094490 [fungal sp. No.11243]
MVFFFEPALLCNIHAESLLLAPLPAEKAIWEAGDAHTWGNLQGQASESRPTFAVTELGELVNIDGGEEGRHRVASKSFHSSLGPRIRGRKTAADWEKWIAKMDSLGALVVLAASFS